jgi:hypothetical protein
MTKNDLILIANHYLNLIGSDKRITNEFSVDQMTQNWLGFIKGEEELDLLMKIDGDLAEVGIIPRYTVKVTGNDEFTGLKWSDVQDFEAAVDELYNYIANNTTPQSVKEINLSDIGITESLSSQLERWTKGKEDKVLYWYTKEVLLPMFHDQTQKHQARQIIKCGLPKPNIHEAINFIVDLVVESADSDAELDRIKTEIENVYK